jgi:hypothetical protein
MPNMFNHFWAWKECVLSKIKTAKKVEENIMEMFQNGMGSSLRNSAVSQGVKRKRHHSLLIPPLGVPERHRSRQYKQKGKEATVPSSIHGKAGDERPGWWQLSTRAWR